ncbi:MAG: hypothetical protein CME70_22330 [Halobacteriovorax sp.]|nr:hypothetical protein [Halobacteriovorax sp.]|tara:strand:- start:104784 stop:106538 length:1755 start_codon:yes stop_codon:yes gene_type:complete
MTKVSVQRFKNSMLSTRNFKWHALSMIFPLLIVTTLFSASANAFGPDWTENARLPESGSRKNIYELKGDEFKKVNRAGKIHASSYPVTVTGALLPYEATRRVVEADTKNPIRRWIYNIGRKSLGFKSMDDMYKWVGLNDFNEEDATGIFKIPYPNDEKPDYPMGATFMKRFGETGLTFSCTTCHSTRLFGKTVFGLNNKRPRANEFFLMGQKHVPKLLPGFFKVGAKATKGETQMYREARKNIMAIGAVAPQVLGLDSSLAQVALSLAKRNQDPYATYNKKLQKNPRPNALEHFVADSKPGVWWNLKYKTRWLRDGSIVSGNPIYTNFLWNEIGRGTDLKKLEKWMKENDQVVKELTAAVFATEAPKWTDFFPAESIDLPSAKRGQKHFKKSCAKCHGAYDKTWDLPGSEELTLEEQLTTAKVVYPKKTRVKDVGTDPNRWMGMQHFSEDLNRLAISKWMKTKVVPQKGYVPPPLVGVFARYPYFHNNSAPSLCDVLSKPKDRTVIFYQGPAEDPETDYDSECVGYPTGRDIPKKWYEEKEAKFDTRKPGLSNSGHYKMFINEDGSEKYSPAEKKELIMFLKTL